jgi:hypothetical protein
MNALIRRTQYQAVIFIGWNSLGMVQTNRRSTPLSNRTYEDLSIPCVSSFFFPPPPSLFPFWDHLATVTEDETVNAVSMGGGIQANSELERTVLQSFPAVSEGFSHFILLDKGDVSSRSLSQQLKRLDHWTDLKKT